MYRSLAQYPKSHVKDAIFSLLGGSDYETTGMWSKEEIQNFGFESLSRSVPYNSTRTHCKKNLRSVCDFYRKEPRHVQASLKDVLNKFCRCFYPFTSILISLIYAANKLI